MRWMRRWEDGGKILFNWISDKNTDQTLGVEREIFSLQISQTSEIKFVPVHLMRRDDDNGLSKSGLITILIYNALHS